MRIFAIIFTLISLQAGAITPKDLEDAISGVNIVTFRKHDRCEAPGCIQGLETVAKLLMAADAKEDIKRSAPMQERLRGLQQRLEAVLPGYDVSGETKMTLSIKGVRKLVDQVLTTDDHWL